MKFAETVELFLEHFRIAPAETVELRTQLGRALSWKGHQNVDNAMGRVYGRRVPTQPPNVIAETDGGGDTICIPTFVKFAETVGLYVGNLRTQVGRALSGKEHQNVNNAIVFETTCTIAKMDG